MSLTRDRLGYTKACFEQLQALAGCPYDHYVLDNGSQDGTVEWLRDEYEPCHGFLTLCDTNIGVSKGMNEMLNMARAFDHSYDVIVKFDNDCEILRRDTLATVCRLVHENPTWILSPKIEGLDSPPPVDHETEVGGERVYAMSMIGGIFMAVPASVYDTYRYDENNPVWGMDDVGLCAWWKSKGNRAGYLADWPANHYETTRGQRERYVEYFER
ncbi:MAG: hypothetical protein NUW01_02935, partial [Gemmatimonadaceae bacterium]|nr:hypothetical protein [Gemmatimonadaceae bacterium]